MTPQAIRRAILETALAAGKGHIASALSWVEIAVALFDTMKPDDRLVLSKTHGHLTLDVIIGDEAPTYPMWAGWPYKCSGSLGQGLGMATGMALANKLDGSSARVFCVLGDAELHEGQIWEAVMFAAHHKLTNLVAIIDSNQQACADFTRDVLDVNPISKKLRAFGWDCAYADGHSVGEVSGLLRRESESPFCLVARTVKGKGISFMEGNPAWHHQHPAGKQIEIARRDVA